MRFQTNRRLSCSPTKCIQFNVPICVIGEAMHSVSVVRSPTKFYMLILIVLLMVAQPALPQQGSEPLTKGQVMDLVKFELDSTELANRIKERGLDFEPTDDDLEALRKAGAQEVVIQAIREVKPKPLTREQVGKLVAGGVPSERAATLVRKRGIDFQADEEYLKTLRVAGADDTLLRALRTASVSELGELLVTTSPDRRGINRWSVSGQGRFEWQVRRQGHRWYPYGRGLPRGQAELLPECHACPWSND